MRTGGGWCRHTRRARIDRLDGDLWQFDRMLERVAFGRRYGKGGFDAAQVAMNSWPVRFSPSSGHQRSTK